MSSFCTSYPFLIKCTCSVSEAKLGQYFSDINIDALHIVNSVLLLLKRACKTGFAYLRQLCQITDGTLSLEWGGTYYHVLHKHALVSKAGPALCCLVCAQACIRSCVCLYITLKCAHPLLSCFRSPTASFVHVLLLSGILFTGTGSPSNTGFAEYFNSPASLRYTCICFCVYCTVSSCVMQFFS